MRNKIITGVLIFAIFALAIFFRTYLPWDKVFSDPIKYSADDGVYHMRLIENELLGGHFPWRINFDPYTYFPYGTYIHFGPLYDFLLCLIIWIASFGKPTIETISLVAPFYPAVMGSLVVFLVYSIGKKIWSKPVGLFSAFLIAIMPPFLYRSLLGNTDHHVGEVFFSTLTILSLVYLIIDGRNDRKKFWIFTILTGFSLGLYFLIWTGALLFLFLIFCFMIFYYLIRYCLGSIEEWILISGGVIFVIALLAIAPFFGHPNFLEGRIYNIQHFICFIGSILAFLVTGLMGNYVRKKNIKPYFLPVILAVSAIFIFCVVKIFVPFLWIELIKIFNEINLGMVDNQFAREFIGEMSPLRLRGAFSSYYALFYLFLISLCILLYRFVKERRPENFFIFIWTIVILVTAGIIPAFGQNRNSYYLSVNISLLAGFLIIEGFLFGWKALKRLDEFEKNSYLRLYFRVSSIIIISAIIFLFLYPFPFNIDDGYPNSLPSLIRSSISTAQNPSVLSDDWYQTFSWLKDNTPDPGIDYYALYKEPKTWAYNYPSQAYSILAPWDVGHDITYYARRIPVANPFQQGIGYINSDGTITPGEGTFFLETDEGRAISYLDRLKTKYIIVSTLLSNPNTTFKSYVKWINGNMESYTSDEVLETQPTKFDLAMSTRLYFLDGSHVFLDKKVKEENIKLEIPQLSHFKLVYESKNDTSIFLENQYSTTKQVKVFEYVKGATIRGYTLPGTRVEISTNVKTNQNREFGYKQETVSKDGSFEFVVPYSTGNQENSDVSAGEYTIKIGNYSIKIRVLNEDIMKGRIIKI